MTAPLLRAWLAALALAAAALLAPFAAPDAWARLAQDPPDAPVWAIGTSLLGCGIPGQAPVEGGLLGDGRRHVRLYAARMSEDEILRAARLALDHGAAETLILEIYPFARSLAFEAAARRAPRGLSARALGEAALGASRAQADRFQAVVGRALGDPDAVDGLLREPDIDRQLRVEPAYLARFYPLELREPRRADDLAALVAAARARGVEVWFLAPPISETSAAYQGPAAVEALRRHVRDLARRLGVPLLVGVEVWPDSLFVDQAHLDRDGRRRLIAELQARWADRRDG